MRQEDVWRRLVAFIGERVNLTTVEIEQVLTLEQEFWTSRPALVQAVLEEEEGSA